jgi:hypothetical protein
MLKHEIFETRVLCKTLLDHLQRFVDHAISPRFAKSGTNRILCVAKKRYQSSWFSFSLSASASLLPRFFAAFHA